MGRLNSALLGLAVALQTGCFAPPPPRPSQVQLLDELSDCVKITKAHKDLYQSPCTRENFSTLVGVTQATVLTFAGEDVGTQHSHTISYQLSTTPKGSKAAKPIVETLHFAHGKVDSAVKVVPQ